CRQALHILEQAVGPDHPDVANVLNTLGQIIEEQGDYAEAESLYRRSVRIMSRFPRAEADVARVQVQSLSHLAGLYRVQGRYRRAEPLDRRALTLAETALGRHDEEVGAVCNNLAVLYKYMGKFPEAAKLYRRALAIAIRVHGSDHPGVATIYHNLGGLEH